MSKKVWNAEAFKGKNEMRKLYKEKDAKVYREGRKLRKIWANNGAFGNEKPKEFNELAIGTSGKRD